jgi:hypothetical protein
MFGILRDTIVHFSECQRRAWCVDTASRKHARIGNEGSARQKGDITALNTLNRSMIRIVQCCTRPIIIVLRVYSGKKSVQLMIYHYRRESESGGSVYFNSPVPPAAAGSSRTTTTTTTRL